MYSQDSFALDSATAANSHANLARHRPLSVVLQVQFPLRVARSGESSVYHNNSNGAVPFTTVYN